MRVALTKILPGCLGLDDLWSMQLPRSFMQNLLQRKNQSNDREPRLLLLSPGQDGSKRFSKCLLRRQARAKTAKPGSTSHAVSLSPRLVPLPRSLALLSASVVYPG